MTRNLVKDYHWICKPSYLKEDALLSKMEETFFLVSKAEIFTSEWCAIRLKKINYLIVFRMVIDGRKDNYGRMIRRYEGSILPFVTDETIYLLENCLREVQEKTNNYGFGNFSNTVSNQKIKLPKEAQ